MCVSKSARLIMKGGGRGGEGGGRKYSSQIPLG